jgi:hypothetical protein
MLKCPRFVSRLEINATKHLMSLSVVRVDSRIKVTQGVGQSWQR